ncbi:MAG: alpha/beta hydrolase [Rhodospirillales bacterium]|nr:alpha/beta hydrolase [Rhodospirillales bacterium]
MARKASKKTAKKSAKKAPKKAVKKAAKAVKKVVKKVVKAAKKVVAKKPAAKKATAGGGFKESTVKADGFTIRYAQAGKGNVLVSIHGAGGMRISPAHELLAKTYRVIVFEVPGFGKSPANERSATMQDLAATMNKAIAALGIKKFSLMGNSFGAKLVSWMAVQAPDTLQTLLLVAPAAIRHDRPRVVGTTPEETRALFHAHPERIPPASPVKPEIEAKQQALVRRLIGSARDAALEGALKGMPVPTLALFGTVDRVTPSDAAYLYREIIPNCHIGMVYDAAHAIDVDRPEAVSEIVADFIERQEKFLVTGQSGVIHP